VTTILDLAKRSDIRTKYRIFRGEFETGATAIWATARVNTATGPVEGRILNRPRARRAIPREYGATPERTSVQLVLANGDDALRELALGSTAATTAGEYGGDSFMSLVGHLYVGYIDSAGTTYEQKITAELRCQSFEVGDQTITLNLVSHDDKHLGDVSRAFTVRSFREATFHTAGDENTIWSPNISSGTFDSIALSAMQRKFTDNLGAFIPFAYGLVQVPCIVGSDAEEESHGLLFAALTQPDLSDESLEFVNAYLGSKDELHRGRVDLWSVRVTIRNEADPSFATTTAWICGWSSTRNEDGPPKLIDFGAQRNRLSLPANFTSTGVEAASPTELARALLTDLSTGGSGGLLSSAFTRAHGALSSDLCGIIVAGGARISEYLQLLGAWCGLSWWVGTDDKVACLYANAWSDADVTAAAGDLPELRWGAEIIAWREDIPSSPNEVGGLASKIGWRWSSAQQRFFGAANLRYRAPGAPVAVSNGSVEAQLRGDAVDPESSLRAGVFASQARTELRRGATAIVRDWLALYDVGQLVRVTHPLGLGTGAARGYDRRLYRIWEIEDGEDDSVTLRLIDCQALSEIKPAVWPALADWVHYDPAGTTRTLQLKAGGVGTTAKASAKIFTTAMVGSHLLTPGAANAGNYKIARRIVALIGASPSDQVTVDEVFTDVETIAAVAGGTEPIDAGWLVVRSQENFIPPNSTELCACDETDGLFRDDSTGGFQATGG
jgi:hypothetical protein